MMLRSMVLRMSEGLQRMVLGLGTPQQWNSIVTSPTRIFTLAAIFITFDKRHHHQVSPSDGRLTDSVTVHLHSQL